MSTPRIVRLSGALADVRPLRGAALYELVRVGERGLLGEVVRVRDEMATVQVYEDTSGLHLGEPVAPTGAPLTVELGPGLIGEVLDGVGRPLHRVADVLGDRIAPGTSVPTLDPERRWPFEAALAPGTAVGPGDVLGTVDLGAGRVHKVLVPPGASGVLDALETGAHRVHDLLGRLADGTALTLAERWPVRTPRPAAARLPGDRPLVTGQRLFDLLFPVAEGGAVAVPGGFGTGKTVIEQSLARYAAADLVVYVGCGERGNEMADLLSELPALEDPVGRPLSERTVLVVNTSNMPVAAREASVYLGFTLAEYYRDQGLRVAILADSLSRWAEALRELGSRLQEMPGEEGYPTSLGNRLAALYERAGRVRCLGSPERTGAVTFVSAISPPGGDLSEPVTQASLRVAGALWALDAQLAHQRQFPAVSWDTSYTVYAQATAAWFAEHGGPDWADLRRWTLGLLQEERELREVAELVGQEALEDVDRLVLEVARIVREGLIGQNAFDPNDARSPLEKTWRLAGLVRALHERARAVLESGASWAVLDLASARRAVLAVRDAPESELGAKVAEAEQVLAAIGPVGGGS